MVNVFFHVSPILNERYGLITRLECGGPPAEHRVTLTVGNWSIEADDLAYQWDPL